MVRPTAGRLLWILDRAAAALLPHGGRPDGAWIRPYSVRMGGAWSAAWPAAATASSRGILRRRTARARDNGDDLAASLAELPKASSRRRAVWVMVPAGEADGVRSGRGRGLERCDPMSTR